MSLLQHQATCTVHDGHGGRCGRVDQCTTVVTVNGQGVELNRHDVCSRCRKIMDLPEHDVTLTAAGEVRRFDGT